MILVSTYVNPWGSFMWIKSVSFNTESAKPSKTDWQFTWTHDLHMIKQMASSKFYIIIIVTSFVLALFHYPKYFRSRFGRILPLLTIKARGKFRTPETAPELYFCQNKNESKLNENEVYWIKMKYLQALIGRKIQCFISFYSSSQTNHTLLLQIVQSQNVVSDMSPQCVLQSEMGKSNT